MQQNMEQIAHLQQQARKALRVVDFGRQVARNPNVFAGSSPDPHENRFEVLVGNKELLSKHRNTQAAPLIDAYASRTELWGKPQPQPPYSDWNTDVKHPRANG